MRVIVDELVGDKMEAIVRACRDIDRRSMAIARPLRGVATTRAALFVAAAGVLGIHGPTSMAESEEDRVLEDLVDIAQRVMTEYLRRYPRSTTFAR